MDAGVEPTISPNSILNIYKSEKCSFIPYKMNFLTDILFGLFYFIYSVCVWQSHLQ